jgi:lipopolysaccharide transport protein LptA
MKRLCLIVMAAGGSLLAQAQMNSSGTLPTARGPTLIRSDSADFDLAGHEATYHGHVRVDDPQMKLACEQLIADVPQAGGHVNHIVAETNVVIDFTDNKGQTNHATSDKAVYIYQEQGGVTNETVTLTGNPQIENAKGTLTGDVIVWDRLNNHMSASNQKMVFRQNFNGAPADTNPPAAMTTPISVVKATNSPPETNENTNKVTGTSQPP